MSKRIIMLALVFVFFAATSFTAAAEIPAGVSAESAVLISGDTGRILFEKDSEKRLSMASTTKIMTALLTLNAAEELGDPVVEITDEMVAVEGSSMGLMPGDRITLSNLAAGMLLASGNDAANSSAIYISGSVESFVEKMNEAACSIGLENTHFETPSGLDGEEHYSTAADMAKLTLYALQNPEFLRIVSSQSLKVEFEYPEKTVSYDNHNRLLREYDGCIGVKTGYTKKSGRCLVSAAERDGVTLVAVTLNAPDDWNDHRAMLDYGFSTVCSVELEAQAKPIILPAADSSQDAVLSMASGRAEIKLLECDKDSLEREVYLPRFLYAPVFIGQQLGEELWKIGDRVVAGFPVLAAGSLR